MVFDKGTNFGDKSPWVAWGFSPSFLKIDYGRLALFSSFQNLVCLNATKVDRGSAVRIPMCFKQKRVRFSLSWDHQKTIIILQQKYFFFNLVWEKKSFQTKNVPIDLSSYEREWLITEASCRILFSLWRAFGALDIRAYGPNFLDNLKLDACT